jgi:GNAT superfamily N-acetyltransferase
MPRDPTPTIRPANPGEAAELSELALRSKAHWGYDAQFLERVRPLLTFTEDDLATAAAVAVLEDIAGEPRGVYRITGAPPAGELEDLWLDPQLIGRGHGRALFEHARDAARARGFTSLTIEADPNAEPFYLAMGAVPIGARRSPSGRDLPLLRLDVAPRSPPAAG